MWVRVLRQLTERNEIAVAEVFNRSRTQQAQEAA
jgi:hypothetical protein